MTLLYGGLPANRWLDPICLAYKTILIKILAHTIEAFQRRKGSDNEINRLTDGHPIYFRDYM